MKHISRVSGKPAVAQVILGDVLDAVGQILQAVGTVIVSKENTDDPYDWSTDTGDTASLLNDISTLL